MTENPHEKEDLSEPPEKLSDKPENGDRENAPSSQGKRRSYYYDDACGYEIYDAENESEDEDQALPDFPETL